MFDLLSRTRFGDEMAKKSKGVVSDLEVPNPHVYFNARAYHHAAVLLFNSGVSGQQPLVAPPLMIGGFALEAYLKSLSTSWHYPEILSEEDLFLVSDDQSLSRFRQTPHAEQEDHDLVRLFDGLPTPVRDDLAARYAADPVLSGLDSLAAALEPYRIVFVKARYPYEDGNGLPQRPHRELLYLLDFMGTYVESRYKSNPRSVMLEQLRIKLGGAASPQGLIEGQPQDPEDDLIEVLDFAGEAGSDVLSPSFVENLAEPLDRESMTLTTVADPEVEVPARVLHPGTIANGTVVLDSGEPLPDESIVEVEVVDESMPGELGVVEAGLIKLDWPDAIPVGTKVTVEVTGKLLSLDQIDPAFKIGDRAVRGGIPDLAENLDHYLYGHPKVEDR